MINRNHIQIFFLGLVFCFHANGQTNYPDTSNKFKGTLVSYQLVDGDTLLYVNLPDFYVYGDYVFKSAAAADYYWKLKRDVKKAYPYAKLASKKLKQYNDVLAHLKNDYQRKQYMRLAEEQIKKEFEAELKKLTFKQGKILIKLIDRETGSSSYNLVKDLRGSFSAFFWQSLARMFGANLKEKYDASGEDKLIEDIVVKIEKGEI